MIQCAREENPTPDLPHQEKTAAWISATNGEQRGSIRAAPSPPKGPAPLDSHLRDERSWRVRGHREVRRLLREGEPVRGEWFTLKVLPSGEPQTRFVCAVRRSACPSAVLRNRVKRWFREAFRRNRQHVSVGYHLMAVVFKVPAKLSYASIEKVLLERCERIVRPGC